MLIILIFVLYRNRPLFIDEPFTGTQTVKCSDVQIISNQNATRIAQYKPIVDALSAISTKLSCTGSCKTENGLKNIVDDINNKLSTLQTVKDQIPNSGPNKDGEDPTMREVSVE